MPRYRQRRRAWRPQAPPKNFRVQVDELVQCGDRLQTLTGLQITSKIAAANALLGEALDECKLHEEGKERVRLEERKRRVLEAGLQPPGIMGWLKGPRYSPEALREAALIDDQIAGLGSNLANLLLGSAAYREQSLEAAEITVGRLRSFLARAHSAVELANQRAAAVKIRQEEALRRKRENRERVAGLAAAHLEKSRRLADRIKRKLADQLKILNVCPYCGGELGVSPCADHIYPVSKGGLSTPRNMVIVCAQCNQDKGDLTLGKFIALHKRDGEAIHRKLALLGKDY